MRYIVGSVTCALILSYPFFLLYTTTSPGLPSVPHHVWTSARQFPSANVSPDISIKQAWVQGSYMGALTPEVVKEALKVQEALLGTEISCTVESPPREPRQFAGENNFPALPQGVFFHSPLLYWNCSLSILQRDANLLETVNTNSLRVSPLNMTLHWSSVFAGKLFSHHRLAAADALVISVFYDTKSEMGEIWDRRAAALVADSKIPGKCDIYPSDGRVIRSTLYEVCHIYSYGYRYILTKMCSFSSSQ